MTSGEQLGARFLEELERIHGYKIDAILPDGTHRYWSTHCRHDNHEACSADKMSGPSVYDRGRHVTVERRPAQCKTPECQAPCVCPCHAAVSGG